METKELIDALNRAIADEWFAHYQYWAGAQVAAGPLEPRTSREFLQHAQDEYSHATTIAARVIALKGKPPISPRAWWVNHFCGYTPPLDPFVLTLLDQNIAGETCAIEFYTALSEKVQMSDPITYTMLQPILAKEKEHRNDLQEIRRAVAALMPRESDGQEM
jgi:bacterioferritin